MAKMESLLSLQDDLSNRIFKARVNCKKSPKERITKDYVKCRLEALEELWYEFRKGHKNLLQVSDPSLLKTEVYITADRYNETEEEFLVYKCELKRHIPDTDTNNDSGACSDPYIKTNLVKLPKINIPIFSGKYTEWITFRDLFVSMIHNNKSLDNVQRLQYLKGFLIGEAEQLIRYIPVSDANYVQCWRLLEERYSNKKYLSHCILNRLLGQKIATSESANYLKELIDTSSDCLNALSNLGIDVSTWDIIIIHLLSNKLDPESRKQWELKVTSNVSSDSLPTYSLFKEFIKSRYRALEFVEHKYVNKQTTGNIRSNVSNPKVLHTTGVSKLVCEFCGEEHKLSFCKKFGSLDCDNRREFVTKNRICYNCLGSNHGVKFCRTPISCKVCNKRHHSLLHPRPILSSNKNSGFVERVAEVSVKDDGVVSSTQGVDITPTVAASHIAYSKIREQRQILLATALVEAKSKLGQCQVIRALSNKDPNRGSQASFITEATVQGLGLKRIPVSNMISGVGGDKTNLVSKNVVLIKIRSRVDPSVELEVKAFVLKNITTHIPGKKISLNNWDELKHLYLADPAYDIPNKIDILLGAEVYCQVLKEGVLRGPIGSPVAQCTSLGWILSGPVGSHINEMKVTALHSQVKEYEIKRFWESESELLLNSKILTADEQRCEGVFAVTMRRTEDSKYIVRLPFRDGDRACKNGVSLNDTLLIGPTLQPDLRHVILNWRKYPVCLVADIVKMYRMVRVAKEDCDYQRIVWREKPEDPIRDYKLLTVTFGTASAPYLAVRTLNQVAKDYKLKYPVAAEKVEKEFYMDDLLTGCQNVDEGIELAKEIDALLKEGGFILQKWSSNREEILDAIHQTEEKGDKELDTKLDNIVKILGLTWNRTRDEFQYSVKLPPLTAPVTKRKIVSDVARLYDPLGWIAPCIIKANIFRQRLWIAKTGWDEEPTEDILNWYTYRNELAHLAEFRLERLLNTNSNNVLAIHGFSDSSNSAYAAVVNLYACKVACAIKESVKQVSIPGLEMCDAVLLAKLLMGIVGVLKVLKGNVRLLPCRMRTEFKFRDMVLVKEDDLPPDKWLLVEFWISIRDMID